ASFDAAYTLHVAMNISDRDRMYAEAARVLKPGAPFVITFSDRWFPTKAIELWTALHPFERMGLVLEYFREAGNFVDLHSESLRGLPRPQDDKYAGQLAASDPVFAVGGCAGN
ncbi:MAG TPA: methyltransferase domain-containing protein, partial [Gammaproteobacteria bacterium]|nr:methyltransferase domain-containing protein [Gammaproteobacteria bacterium]